MAFTLIETVDSDPNFILAQCSEEEKFKSGDYVWITNKIKQWVGQLTQPPIPIHRSNQKPTEPALLNLAELMAQNPGILPGEIAHIIKIEVRGEITDGEMGEIETRWTGGAQVRTMTADDVVKYLRIPVYKEIAGCGSNAIGINTNAANTPFCLPEIVLDSHVMVCGATNSGKSNVVTNLIALAASYGDCVFIYDSKPDFRLIAETNSDLAVAEMWKAFKHLRKVPYGFSDVYSIGFHGKCNKDKVKKVIGFWASSFEPDELGSLFFVEKKDRLQGEVFAAAAFELQARLLTDGYIHPGGPNHYTIEDILEHVNQARPTGKGNAGAPASSTINALLVKVRRRAKRLTWLDAIGQPVDQGIWGGINARLVEEFHFSDMVSPGRIVHVSLESIRRPSDHAMILAFFLRAGFNYCHEDDSIGITQAIEEASRVFKNDSEFAAPLLSAFYTAVQEGRTRNQSMILSLQNASQLPADVMQNLCTHIVMKQNNLRAAKDATQAMGEEFAQRATRLARGKALVKMDDSPAILSVRMAPSPCELERIDNKGKLK